jgi:hypothetical protein
MSDLCCTRHTLAGSDGLSNRRDGTDRGSIIERTVNSGDVPLLCMDPLQKHCGFDRVSAQTTKPPERSTWISFGRRGAFVPSLPTPRSPSVLIHERG